MAYQLNQKICDLVPYEPIQGSYQIRLDANESYCSLPTAMLEEISQALVKIHFNRYPDPYASDVITAFADYYNIPQTQVTAGNGSDELISIIISCFLEKGDKILTTAPDFSMYQFYGSLYEMNVISLTKNSDLVISVDQLIKNCNQNQVQALIFSNPCNPTAQGISKNEMTRLLKNVSCLVILDEAYMDFWSESLLSDIEKYDNLIILRTCSKAIGMAAIRLGFAVANTTLTKALRAVKSPYNTDSLSQQIGAYIFRQKDWLTDCRRKIISSRSELYTDLSIISKQYPSLGYVFPSVTNFVLIRSDLSDEIYQELLNCSIAIRKMGSYLRITAGAPEENRILIKHLQIILENLKRKGEKQ